MRLYPVFVRRIVAAVSGAINFPVNQKVGFRQTVVGNLRAATQRAGFSAGLGSVRMTTLQRLGLKVSTSGSGTAAKPQHLVGLRTSNSSSGTAVKPQHKGGARLARISYALTGDYGANLTGQELLLKDALLSTPDVRSYWSLGEASGSAVDQGPQNAPGTPNGTLTRDVAGLVGAAAGNDGAVTFGAGGYLDMGDVHDLTGAHTIELLARLNTLPADGDYNLVAKSAGLDSPGWKLVIQRLLGSNVFYSRNGSGQTGGHPGPPVSQTAITHFAKTAGVPSAATQSVTLYQDAVQTFAAPVTVNVDTATPLRVRRHDQNLAHAVTLDEVAIFNRALDASEITFHNSVRLGASTGDWTNLANAQGKRNGTLASIPGNALAPRAGNLICDYADFPNKAQLAISKVELRFYTRRNNVASLGTFMDHRYRFGASQEWVVLEQYTGLLSEHNHLTTPEVYDITSVVGGDWAKLNSLQAGVFANVGILAILGDTVECDAVELHVEASVTDNF